MGGPSIINGKRHTYRPLDGDLQRSTVAFARTGMHRSLDKAGY